MSDIPRNAPFTGHGWRRQGQPGCFAQSPKPRHVNVAIGGVETTYPWRCERIKGHTGSHCCDNSSWPQEKTHG